MLLNSLLSLLCVPLLPISWLSFVPNECLMECIRAPPASWQTYRQNILTVKKHHEYARLATFSVDVFEVYILVTV